MGIKKKIFKILLITIIVVIPLGYYFNQFSVQKALDTVIEIDRTKNKVLFTKQEADYDKYVDNKKLKEYYKTRDKYNILWASNNNVANIKSTVGYCKHKGLALFNRCFVFFTAQSNVIDTREPVEAKAVSYNRFVILRAKSGSWYVVKDISQYGNKISIRDILDSSYLDKKISEYKDYIKNYYNN